MNTSLAWLDDPRWKTAIHNVPARAVLPALHGPVDLAEMGSLESSAQIRHLVPVLDAGDHRVIRHEHDTVRAVLAADDRGQGSIVAFPDNSGPVEVARLGVAGSLGAVLAREGEKLLALQAVVDRSHLAVKHEPSISRGASDAPQGRGEAPGGHAGSEAPPPAASGAGTSDDRLNSSPAVESHSDASASSIAYTFKPVSAMGRSSGDYYFSVHPSKI